MGYLYILQSLTNHRYYIGSTSNLKLRIEQHNNGESRYTRLTKPFELVFSKEYSSRTSAYKAEYWLKQQKDKKLIEQIIKDGEFKKEF